MQVAPHIGAVARLDVFSKKIHTLRRGKVAKLCILLAIVDKSSNELSREVAGVHARPMILPTVRLRQPSRQPPQGNLFLIVPESPQARFAAGIRPAAGNLQQRPHVHGVLLPVTQKLQLRAGSPNLSDT